MTTHSMDLAQRIAIYLDRSDASYEAKLLHMAKMIDTELAPASRDHAAMEAMRVSLCGVVFDIGDLPPGDETRRGWFVMSSTLIAGKSTYDDPADAILNEAKEAGR